MVLPSTWRNASDGVVDRLKPGAPAQIGVHHVALDRPRPDDRHLDHEIIEFARAQPRQHRHLGAAFDLKDAERIGARQHLVDRRILGRHGGEIKPAAEMPLDQRKRLFDAGQHAERQDIDLQNSERVEIVLVPFDDGAVRHRRILDRHQFGQWPAGDYKAADMLRQVTRKASQLGGEVERQAQGAVAGVEPGLAHPLFGDRVVAPAPDDPGQGRDDIDRQAQRLADLADR